MNAPEPGTTFMHVRLNVAEVHEVEKGTFEVVIPVKQLSAEHYKLLDTLFPNTYGQVERLLATEALIKTIKH